jgi:nitroreductase
MIADLVLKNRSCRRFYQDHAVSIETLRELVDLARMSASGANLQPLKYILSCRPDLNAEIFECLGWAGYIKQWPGPVEGERPSAHIIILGDTGVCKNFGCDHGIAAQSILLGAREKELAGCMIGSIERKKLKSVLNIANQYEILLVIAMGKPREEVRIETMESDGDFKYWRDDKEVHHVPKRPMEDIIIHQYHDHGS